MDQPIPEQLPTPEPSRVPAPPTARDRRIEARLYKLIGTDERIVTWARGWVSRDVRLHPLFAARTLDFAVSTETSLVLVTTGFFTRRPRRRVFVAPFDDIVATRESVPRGRRLRISANDGPTFRIELRASERGRLFAAAVAALAGREPE